MAGGRAEGGTGGPTMGDAGLSVPLGVHFDAIIADLYRFLEERDARYATQRHDDLESVKLALTASKELAQKHNDLIRASEKKEEKYATKDELSRLESFQAKLVGGMTVVAVIGVANFVRLFIA